MFCIKYTEEIFMIYITGIYLNQPYQLVTHTTNHYKRQKLRE